MLLPRQASSPGSGPSPPRGSNDTEENGSCAQWELILEKRAHGAAESARKWVHRGRELSAETFLNGQDQPQSIMVFL